MCNILVIDDEKPILETLKAALNIFGHTVQLAVDGRDGIEKFEENRFDIVITDINMPNLDGFGVAQHIRRSRRPETPIIALTGMPSLVYGKDDDFDKVLEKPFRLQFLADTVKDLANKPCSCINHKFSHVRAGVRAPEGLIPR